MVPGVAERIWWPRGRYRLRDPKKPIGNDTRLASKHFKSVIEHICIEEHVPKTKLVFAFCE